MALKESDLYPPIKKYLEHQGYQVNAEVAHCDVTARKGDELIIIELKVKFGISLLIQAVERQRITDSVYVAIPVPPGKSLPPNYKGIKLLLRKLEIGLILVYFLKRQTKVEVAFHPDRYEAKKNRQRKKEVIRELSGRIEDFNTGGTTSSVERITTYKQNAIQIAVYLGFLNKATPAILREKGTGPKTQSILKNNYYGWYERIGRGLYRLHPQGQEAIKKYPELAAYYSDLFYTDDDLLPGE
jgi:hypothetical protein